MVQSVSPEWLWVVRSSFWWSGYSCWTTKVLILKLWCPGSSFWRPNYSNLMHRWPPAAHRSSFWWTGSSFWVVGSSNKWLGPQISASRCGLRWSQAFILMSQALSLRTWVLILSDLIFQNDDPGVLNLMTWNSFWVVDFGNHFDDPDSSIWGPRSLFWVIQVMTQPLIIQGSSSSWGGPVLSV